jgi:hypothetical protein
LMCQPIGHEYMACYRAMRQTAVRLSQAGVPGFRFDYYGSGDSAGDASEGTPHVWLQDIGAAALEIRQRERAADTLCVLGMRLGATLALLGAPAHHVRALILWDPITDGRHYVEELFTLQAQRFDANGNNEVLGFPFPSRLRTELESLDLLAVTWTAPDVLIVETGDGTPDAHALAGRLRTLGAAVEHRRFPGHAIWHEPNKAAVPAQAIQGIVSWVRDTLARR